MPVVLFKRNGEAYTVKCGDRLCIHESEGGYDHERRVSLWFEAGGSLWRDGDLLYFKGNGRPEAALLVFPFGTSVTLLRRNMEVLTGLKVIEERVHHYNDGSNGKGSVAFHVFSEGS